MKNLPFDKWKLSFHSADTEAAYDKAQNIVRLLAFKIINLFITLAAFVGVITFLAQHQSVDLILYMASISGGSFLLLLFSRKLQPKLKIVFSLYYLWSVTGFIFVALNGFQVPQFIIGFNCCSTAIGAMQYGDTRMKLIFSIITPIALLLSFDVFQVSLLPFLFLTIACSLFIGFWTYMNEYQSRLVFSLNIIANKQKELFTQYVTDGLVALSLQQITRQFSVEFHNTKFFDFLEQNCSSTSNQDKINSNIDDNMKQFLRNSYIITESNLEEKQIIQRNLQKYQKLEDYCFIQIKEDQDSMIKQDESLEIVYQIKDDITLMKLQIKNINFGKPLLFLVIKEIQKSQKNEKYETLIRAYENIIILNTEKQIKCLLQVHNKLKQLPIKKYQKKQLTLSKDFFCTILQQLNYLRNFIVFFEQQEVRQAKMNLNNSDFSTYISSIEQYFSGISFGHNIQFDIFNLIPVGCMTKINTQFLTQLLLNIYDEILKHKEIISKIILKIHQVQKNIQQKQEFSFFNNQEENKQAEDMLNSTSHKDKQLISFTFIFQSWNRIDFVQFQKLQIKPKFQNNQILSQDNIFFAVNQILLSKLGPFQDIKIIQNNASSDQSTLNTLQLLIYQDSSVIEPAFQDFIQK